MPTTFSKQTTKAVLKSSQSVALDTLDSSKFYDASLIGNSLTGTAHTVLKGLTSVTTALFGDSLSAVGDYVTLVGGAGNDSLKALGAKDLLIAGGGVQTLVASKSGTAFQFVTAAQIGNDSVVGGAGIDSLILTKAVGTLGDTFFTKISGTEVLSLTGANSVTLGAVANTAGLKQVIGGGVNSSYLQDAAFTNAVTLQGGVGKDTFSVANRSQLAADSIIGGGGADTLVVRGAGAITDADFAQVSAIGSLSLGAASSVTLGTNAAKAGLVNVFSGDGAVRLEQGLSNTSSLTLRGGKGNDTFVVPSAALLRNDVITAGDGLNALVISSADTNITDDAFGKVSGIQSLSLTSASSVTLGAGAAKAGITLVSGGTGSDTIIQDAKGPAKIEADGGASSDFFGIGSVKQLAVDTIKGSTGTDTLALLTPGAVADISFAYVTGVEALSLNGASSVTLDQKAALAGFSTVYGGDGLTSITHKNASSLTIVGGSGKSFVTVSDGAKLASDSIVAGSGATGTLAVATDSSLADSAFSRIQNFGILSLTGASDVELGAAASAAKITTVIGGLGNSTYTQTANSKVFIKAGKGSDVFTVTDSLLANDTFLGGGGIDTLGLTGNANVTDDAFANHIGLQVLSLDGNASLTLDANALKTGILSVIGGTGDLAVTQSDGNTAALTLVGGEGDSRFLIATAAQLAKDSIVGGTGYNTLSILNGAVLADKSFAKVQGVEALSLTDDSSVILGANASASGFQTIYGGAGNTAITQTADNKTPLTIVGGTGTDTISLASGDYLSANSIVGGTGGATIAIASAATLEDDAFSQIQSVQALRLTGPSNLVLDTNATAAGIQTVYGGVGNSNYSLLSGAVTFVSGKGNDLFTVQEAGQISDASFVGGGGVDTLQILDDSEIDDGMFDNVAGVKFLSLNGSSSVVLDSSAMTAGIAFVAAGDGDSTLTQGEGFTGPLQLLGGEGDDSITVDSVDLLAKDVINGNDGIDTLVIANEGVILNTSLAKVRGVEVLQLTGASSALLGANALKDNLQTIVGGDGATTITQAIGANLPLYIDGSATESIVVGVANGALLSNDTVVGGDGEDTLVITGAAKLTDDVFEEVTNFEVLSLTGASAVTLGDNVSNSGITTVYGGAGNNTFTHVNTDGALSIIAQDKNDLFIVDPSLLADDTFDGGGGVNTLRISTDAEIEDDSFGNIVNVQALQLTGTSTVTLGSSANDAGITLVAANSGGDTIVQTADFSNALRVIGAGGDDLFELETVDLLSNDTIVGGGGIDTLALDNGAEISDDSFKNLKQIGVLSLTGANTVSLGSAARGAGLQTIQGGDDDSTYIQTAGAFTIIGGDGNDVVSVLSNKMLAADSISGGEGDNTLVVSAATKLIDDNFGNVSGFDILSLTGASAVTLGDAASSAGITSVLGGEGASTFYHDSDASLYLDGTANTDGGNLFIVASTDQIANDTFAGAGADQADTLKILGDNTIDDGVLSDNITGITALQLDGSSSANLDVVGAAGFLTLFGGSDSGTYTADQGSAGLLLKAGSNADLITISDIGILDGQTFDGGLGNDTLEIAADGLDVEDAAFTNLISIDTVIIDGAANVSLDSAANAAGITAVSLGDGADSTFTQLENSTLALSLTSGDGNDLFSINDAKQLTKDFLVANDGVDTLQIVTDENRIFDQNFARISGFEAISLGANDTLELGSLATDGLVADAGATLVAGLGGTYLNAAKYGNALVVDASTDVDGNNNLILGSTGSTVLMGSSDALASSTIIGGSDSDTLALTGTDGYTLDDEAFADKAGLDVLLIGSPYTESDDYEPNAGDNVITFGSNATKSGITTLIGGAGNTTLNQVQGNLTTLYFDGSAAETNYVTVEVPKLANNDTFVGGDNVDTLVIGFDNGPANPVNEVTDDAFANINGFEILSLVGTASVELGDNASANGLLSVVGGEGDLAVSQTAGSFVIDGTASSSVTVLLDTPDLLADGESIIGGSGETDVLTFNSNDSVSDEALQYVSGIEILSLTGDANVELGDNASGNGLMTVVGGNGDLVVSQTAGALTIDGSASASVLVTLDTPDLLADGELIIGGDNEDTLTFNANDSVTDDMLALVTGVEILSLNGSANVELADNAGANGLKTVILGDGDSTVLQTAGALTIDGSASGSMLVTLDDAALLSDGESIVGGDNEDTLTFNANDSVTDDMLGLVSGVEILSLTGDAKVELGGNASSNGLLSVVGGEGDLLVTQTDGAFVIDGTASSSVTVLLDTPDLLADGESIIGGSGETDVLTFNSNDSVSDDALQYISGIEILSLTGSANVELADNAAGNGLLSVVGGSGDLTVNQTAGVFTIDGTASGSVTVLLDSTDLLTDGESIIGGSGEADVLTFNSNDTVTDEMLGLVSGVEILSLTGSANVELSDNAAANGLTTVVLGEGDSTVLQTAGAFTIDGSASGSMVVTLDDAALLAEGEAIIGGANEDTLTFNANDSVTDEMLGLVSGVEFLSLTGSASVSLGDKAAASGLLSVAGGDGDLAVLQTAGALTIDGSASSSMLVTLDTPDLLTDGESIIGSSGDADTLTFNANDSVTDDMLALVSGVEILSLTGSGKVSLDANAAGNGLMSVVGGEGDLLVTQTDGAFVIDGTASSSVTVLLDTPDLLADGESIIGGSGETDVLTFNSNDSVGDEALQYVSGIEILSLTGDANVELGDNASGNGLQTIVGGDGNLVVNQTAGAFVIDGTASASVLVTLDTPDLLADGELVIGGANEDTLTFNANDSVTDDMLGLVSGVEILSLTGDANVELADNAGANGLKTVILGDGDSTVLQTAGALTIDGSASGSMLVTLDDAALLSDGESIVGGDNEDTLTFNANDSVTDDMLGLVSGVEILSLTGDAKVELGEKSADIGLLSVVGGDGDLSVTQTAGAFTIDGSASGSVTVLLDTPDLLADAESIIGGSGETDVLTFTSNDTVTDDALQYISGIEILSLTGSASVELADNAAGNGLLSVVGGDGELVVSQTAGAFTIDGSASSGVTVLLDTPDLLTDGESIIGGSGESDVLTFTSNDEVTDEMLGLVSGVEILSLTGSANVELSDNAAANGLTTVVLGDGESTVLQTAGVFTIDGSASGSMVVTLDDAALLAEGEAIIGGGNEDTLTFNANDSVTDEMLGLVSGVEFLSLTGSASVSLGDNAAANGLMSVVGGDGDLAVLQTAGALTIDGSASSSVMVTLDTPDLLKEGESIIGSDKGMEDTLTFNANDSVTDDMLGLVSGVEILSLTGSGKVSLDGNAAGNGLLSVIGGSGDLVVNQTDGAFTIDGSASGSVFVTLDDAALLGAGEAIIGGANEDTLTFNTNDSVTDVMLGKVSDFEILSLTGDADVELGANAGNNGLTTVLLGKGSTTVMQTAGTFLIDGSAATSDNAISVSIANAALAADDTILGGAGTEDTLAVLTGNIDDDVLANKSGFEALAVGAGASITLAANAGALGITSIYGGAGNSTITQTSDNTSALYMDAAQSGSVCFVIDSAALASNDTFVGGAGKDTLTLLNGATAGDELLANATKIDVLALTDENSIELGTNASQLQTVIGGAGDTTISQTAGSMALDLSKSKSSTITLASDILFRNDTISGAIGNDAITIKSPSVISDSDFAYKSKIELLQLTGNASLTLSAKSYAAGIQSVIGGTGDLHVELGADQKTALTIDGGAASSSYFQVYSGDQAVGLGSLVGASSGSSTLSIGEGITTDDAFGHVKGIAVLQLNGSSNLTMNAAAGAITSMHTVVGGAGHSTITQGASQINALLLDGRPGSDNLFVIAQAGQVSNDTIYGGSGVSTLGISAKDTLDDANLTNVHNVDVLTLAGGSEADLGANLDLAGISTIIAGSGDTSTINAGGSAANLVIDGSRGTSADVLTAGGGNDILIAGAKADTLTGGAGADQFVLGSGKGEDAVLITDFNANIDTINLRNFGGSASGYSFNGVSGDGFTNQLLFGTSLVANINIVAGNASDILTHALFA